MGQETLTPCSPAGRIPLSQEPGDGLVGEGERRETGRVGRPGGPESVRRARASPGQGVNPGRVSREETLSPGKGRHRREAQDGCLPPATPPGGSPAPSGDRRRSHQGWGWRPSPLSSRTSSATRASPNGAALQRRTQGVRGCSGPRPVGTAQPRVGDPLPDQGVGNRPSPRSPKTGSAALRTASPSLRPRAVSSAPADAGARERARGEGNGERRAVRPPNEGRRSSGGRKASAGRRPPPRSSLAPRSGRGGLAWEARVGRWLSRPWVCARTRKAPGALGRGHGRLVGSHGQYQATIGIVVGIVELFK